MIKVTPEEPHPTEIFRRMYDEPIHPKNLWLKEPPRRHADVDEVYRANIERLVARGSFTLPARSFPGARYIPAGDPADEDEWEKLRELWTGPADEGESSGAGSCTELTPLGAALLP